MSVTKQKLEEIFKVYEDKKNHNPNTIKTTQIGPLFIIQQNQSDLQDYFHPKRKQLSFKKKQILKRLDFSLYRNSYKSVFNSQTNSLTLITNNNYSKHFLFLMKVKDLGFRRQWIHQVRRSEKNNASFRLASE